jgi:hypothetical protein
MGATMVEHPSEPTLISAQPVDPLLQANRRVPFNVIERTLRSQSNQSRSSTSMIAIRRWTLAMQNAEEAQQLIVIATK